MFPFFVGASTSKPSHMSHHTGSNMITEQLDNIVDAVQSSFINHIDGFGAYEPEHTCSKSCISSVLQKARSRRSLEGASDNTHYWITPEEDDLTLNFDTDIVKTASMVDGYTVPYRVLQGMYPYHTTNLHFLKNLLSRLAHIKDLPLEMGHDLINLTIEANQNITAAIIVLTTMIPIPASKTSPHPLYNHESGYRKIVQGINNLQLVDTYSKLNGKLNISKNQYHMEKVTVPPSSPLYDFITPKAAFSYPDPTKFHSLVYNVNNITVLVTNTPNADSLKMDPYANNSELTAMNSEMKTRCQRCVKNIRVGEKLYAHICNAIVCSTCNAVSTNRCLSCYRVHGEVPKYVGVCKKRVMRPLVLNSNINSKNMKYDVRWFKKNPYVVHVLNVKDEITAILVSKLFDKLMTSTAFYANRIVMVLNVNFAGEFDFLNKKCGLIAIPSHNNAQGMKSHKTGIPFHANTKSFHVLHDIAKSPQYGTDYNKNLCILPIELANMGILLDPDPYFSSSIILQPNIGCTMHVHLEEPGLALIRYYLATIDSTSTLNMTLARNYKSCITEPYTFLLYGVDNILTRVTVNLDYDKNFLGLSKKHKTYINNEANGKYTVNVGVYLLYKAICMLFKDTMTTSVSVNTIYQALFGKTMASAEYFATDTTIFNMDKLHSLFSNIAHQHIVACSGSGDVFVFTLKDCDSDSHIDKSANTTGDCIVSMTHANTMSTISSDFDKNMKMLSLSKNFRLYCPVASSEFTSDSILNNSVSKKLSSFSSLVVADSVTGKDRYFKIIEPPKTAVNSDHIYRHRRIFWFDKTQPTDETRYIPVPSSYIMLSCPAGINSKNIGEYGFPFPDTIEISIRERGQYIMSQPFHTYGLHLIEYNHSDTVSIQEMENIILSDQVWVI